MSTPPGRALLLFLAGGLWTRHRKWEAGLCGSPLCLRCGKADDTTFHYIWECEGNVGPAAGASAHLARQAKAEHLSDPAVWLRGPIPAKLADVGPLPATDGMAASGRLVDDLFVPCGGTWDDTVVLFRDAPGGQYQSPLCRRV